MVITASVNPKLKLTYEDYASLPDDERYELIDGELMPMPSPKKIHQRLILDLSWILRRLEEMGLGELFIAPFDVILSATNVVQPDLIFVSSARAHIITEDKIRGAPDLLVEIISPSTERRDRIVKRDLYARHGVREYWLIDPYAKTVTVLILGAGGYDTHAVYEEGDTLTSPTLPGFAPDLGELFQS